MKRGPKVPPIKSGAVFNKITVLKEAPSPEANNPRVLCRCHCGQEFEHYWRMVCHNRIHSCGCWKGVSYSKRIGQKFGLLTVLKLTGVKDLAECQCDCGKKAVVRISNLVKKNTSSCGCQQYSGLSRYYVLKREKTAQQCAQLVGQRFGRLTVVSVVPDVSNRLVCQCDCGKQKVVSKYFLLNHSTRSCGCLKIRCKVKLPSGEMVSAYQEAIKRGIKHCTINARLNHYGWSIEEAVFTPVRPNHKIMTKLENGKEIRGVKLALSLGIPQGVFYGRLRYGWSVEKAATTPLIPRFTLMAELPNGKKVPGLQLARKKGISKRTFYQRIQKLGWSVTKAATTPLKYKRSV